MATITIEWTEVECDDRNGDITSYSVRYGPSSTPSSDGSVETINDPNSRTFSVGGLLIRTNYNFEVAALNGHGIGPYRTNLTATPIPSGKYKLLNLLL